MVSHLIKTLLMLIMSIGWIHASTTSDKAAGYDDGCRSARGHYTRSAYAYRHSQAYHRAWRRGKRHCTSAHPRKHRRRHSRSVRRHYDCTTTVPWLDFQRGWRQGSHASRAHTYATRRGCGAYRRGWIDGYRNGRRAKHAPKNQYVAGYTSGCSSVESSWIRNDTYYQKYARYRQGWHQGYTDCRSLYR